MLTPISRIVRFIRAKGFEITRLSTHRGISLLADVRRLLGEKDEVILFDVGANRGDFSMALTKQFPRGQIFAFEPIATTFELLKLSTRNSPQIHAFNYALGQRTGTARMSNTPLSACNRVLDPSAAHLHGEAGLIEMRTLDDFVREAKLESIDLLKTDCEGYDFNVLQGCENLLKDRAIRLVYCEVDMHGLGNHGDFFKINDYLRFYGYAFYALYDYSGVNSPQAESFCNALWIDDRWPT